MVRKVGDFGEKSWLCACIWFARNYSMNQIQAYDEEKIEKCGFSSTCTSCSASISTDRCRRPGTGASGGRSLSTVCTLSTSVQAAAAATTAVPVTAAAAAAVARLIPSYLGLLDDKIKIAKELTIGGSWG